MSYFQDYYHRFFFLIGQTDDEFCPSLPSLLNIENMLHWHFLALGYQRIVFYNMRQKIFFLDSKSAQLARSNTQSNGQQPKRKSAVKRDGPVGTINIRKKKETSSSTTTSTRMTFGKMSDLEAATTLNRFMMDDNTKSVIIFSDGLNFISQLDIRAQPLMKSILTEWGSRLSSANQNLCIFCIHGNNTARISEIFQQHGWDFLQNLFMENENQLSQRVISIGSPRQDEVLNLLHYWRLKRNLETNWLELTQSVDWITRHLLTKGNGLKRLSFDLQSIPDLNIDSLQKLSEKPEESAWERLQKMHGLGVVIEKLEGILKLFNEEKSEIPDIPHPPFYSTTRLIPRSTNIAKKVNLHLVLKGNPGTGKTTVARLIAEIFREEGLLELGHMVEVSRKDLVAGYVGQTAIRTAEKIANAMGGVLFVDEAYQLSEGGENDFGLEAIETIMKAMSDHIGEFSVVIAGYPSRIDKFIESNPGLHRRFGDLNQLTIPDYGPEVLQSIFEQHVEKEGYFIDATLLEKLLDFFTNWVRYSDDEKFGNAGEIMETLFPAMKTNRITRTHGEKTRIFTVDDIPSSMQRYLKPTITNNPDTILETLDHLIGLNHVKKQVKNLINAFKIQTLRNTKTNSVILPRHYIFVGNPGTGKTTVARIFGEILKSLNILRKGHMIEAVRNDFVDSYQGGTSRKTTELLEKSLDGVLFIDEAYQLLQNERDDVGREAVETLLTFMENHRDRLCIIIAGYPNEMDKFIKSNPGLPSRFSSSIRFENYNTNEMLEIIKLMCDQDELILESGAEESLKQIFVSWESSNNLTFGNARDVRKLLDEIKTHQSNRLVEEDVQEQDKLQIIITSDIEGCKGE